ncbi:MAG: hypothetical protein QOI48_3839 [Solirubrobacteraceae bacterium]|nr:hypothetical protein [Solirubrobacteraceae bacterium]
MITRVLVDVGPIARYRTSSLFAGAALATLAITLGFAATPAVAAGPAEGLAQAGRWEAEGPGGARLAFVVTADGQRRFAGDMVALCGEHEADWGAAST